MPPKFAQLVNIGVAVWPLYEQTFAIYFTDGGWFIFEFGGEDDGNPKPIRLPRLE